MAEPAPDGGEGDRAAVVAIVGIALAAVSFAGFGLASGWGGLLLAVGGVVVGGVLALLVAPFLYLTR